MLKQAKNIRFIFISFRYALPLESKDFFIGHMIGIFLGHSNKDRRHTMRFLCMLMLVLMHFDIYGEGVVSFLCLPDIPVPHRIASDNTSNETQGTFEYTQLEWEDSDYRRPASRLSHIGRPYFHIIVFNLQEPSLKQTCFHQERQLLRYAHTDVCLLHCLLII